MFGVFGVASFSKRIDILDMPDQVYEEPRALRLGTVGWVRKDFGVVVPEHAFRWMMDRRSIFCFKSSKQN